MPSFIASADGPREQSHTARSTCWLAPIPAFIALLLILGVFGAAPMTGPHVARPTGAVYSCDVALDTASVRSALDREPDPTERPRASTAPGSLAPLATSGVATEAVSNGLTFIAHSNREVVPVPSGGVEVPRVDGHQF